MDILQKDLLQNGFSLDRLRSLLAVHEAGYIAKAAGGNRVKANQISRQISELEKFFGGTLKTKEGKLVKLSQEGIELANITKSFFRSLGHFQDELDGVATPLSIGTGNSIIETLLMPQLKQLCKVTSGARIMFRNLRSSDIANQITQGNLDLGILSQTRLPKSLTSRPLGKVTFLLCVPLSIKKNLKFNDPIKIMSECPLATIDGQGETRVAIEEEFRAKGLSFRPTLEFSGYGLVSNAIASKQFCGILPSYFQQQFPKKDFKFTQIQGLKKLTREYVITWSHSMMSVKEKTMTGAIDAVEKIFWKANLREE